MTQSAAAPSTTQHSAASSARLSQSRGLCTLVVMACVLATVIYSWFLVEHMARYASASDASGYFNSAKLMVHGRTDVAIHRIAGLQPPNWNWYYQQPLGFEADQATGRMVPTYPSGLPLLLLAASRAVGWEQAATLVNLVTAFTAALLLWLVARRLGLSRLWAFAGTAIWLCCPLVVHFSLQPMSDMPATALSLAAIWSALKAREHRGWSIGVGAAVGMAVLVRPTNLLLVVPVLYLLGLDWRRAAGLVLGGLPFAIFLSIYNLALYGRILTTGYGNIDSLLSLEFVPHNIAHFAKWTVILFTPIILLAVALPWSRVASLRTKRLIALWVVTIVGFYFFYFHTGETWWYLRFILPAFPALLIAALLVLGPLVARLDSRLARTAAALLLVSLVLFSEARWNRKLETTAIGQNDRAYYDAANWMKVNLAPDSVVAAMQMSGALHYYTDFPLIRYDLIAPEGMARLQHAARTHHLAIYAALFPFELPRLVDAHWGGRWEKIATIQNVTIWRLEL